jgi:phosphoesterase RecJ-like protein
MSQELIFQIISKLKDRKCRNVAIAMHNGPDGDSIGSAVALEKTLLKLGKNVDIILQNKISTCYSKIIGENRVNKIFIPPLGKVYDVVVLLDCSDINRTVDNIRKMAKFMIAIDHHYGSKPIGNIYYYEKAASTGIILHKIIKRMIPIDQEIANALYLTIRSDTCSFKNSNTDIKAHETAGELLLRGADIHLMNEIYENKSLSLIRLLGNTLGDVYYDSQYKITYLIVRMEQIKKSNSNYEEASMLIDYIRGVNGAEITLLFIEGYDSVKIKARSKYTNVSEILSYFSGGGHPTAAGATVYGDDIYRVVESTLYQTKEYINNKQK